MANSDMQSNSQGWVFYVKASFAISILAMVAGIFFMPGAIIAKGYMGICSLFMMSSTISLSKTLRDEHEGQRLMNKISDAKTQQIIKEYTDV